MGNKVQSQYNLIQFKGDIMARMHARKRGSSGSKRVYRDSAPEWVELAPDEVEKRVLELYEEGNEPSMIGMVLRDRYGVPSVKQVTGKKLAEILKENNAMVGLPEDLKSLIQKALNLRRHAEEHHKDVHNIRGMQLTEAKVRRLAKYYKKKGVLPSDWKYNPKRLQIELSK